MYIYTHTHVHIYTDKCMYIYIYIYTYKCMNNKCLHDIIGKPGGEVRSAPEVRCRVPLSGASSRPWYVQVLGSSDVSVNSIYACLRLGSYKLYKYKQVSTQCLAAKIRCDLANKVCWGWPLALCKPVQNSERSVFIISNRKISNWASQILKANMLLVCPYCLKFQIGRV